MRCHLPALPALLAVLLAPALAGCLAAPAAEETPGPAPAVRFEGARFDTDLGSFTAVLWAEDAPATVGLYRAFLDEGYFVGRSFGRVVPGHVIQVTDLGGTGATEDPRRVPLEASPRLNFSAGALGVARGEDPSSGGPEFFVMDYATSHLWGNFTVFGQVVEGLEVVRAIARVQALDAPRAPAPAPPLPLPFDRMAVDPVVIQAAERIEVVLPAEAAAQLPARVGRNVREGDYRTSLEWPADLAPGMERELVWYVRPYNGSASLDPATLAMRVEGPAGSAAPPEAPALAWDAAFPEILRWRWAPRLPGAHTAVLTRDGADFAAIGMDILAPPIPGPG